MSVSIIVSLCCLYDYNNDVCTIMQPYIVRHLQEVNEQIAKVSLNKSTIVLMTKERRLSPFYILFISFTIVYTSYVLITYYFTFRIMLLVIQSLSKDKIPPCLYNN